MEKSGNYDWYFFKVDEENRVGWQSAAVKVLEFQLQFRRSVHLGLQEFAKGVTKMHKLALSALRQYAFL